MESRLISWSFCFLDCNPSPTISTFYSFFHTMLSPPPEDMLESLPIISLSAFLSNAPSDRPTSAQLETAEQLDRACQEYGFFYLSDHGINQELLDRVIDVGGRFFTENGAEEKMKIKIRSAGDEDGGDGARGYQMVGENVTQGLKVRY